MEQSKRLKLGKGKKHLMQTYQNKEGVGRLIYSVTRFGKISPIGQNFKSLWLFSEGLFCIRQNFDPNWANLYDIGQIFTVANGPIMKR